MKKMIVIGSGIVGATVAYKLAKHGIDVTVIDRQDDGQATEAAAGIIAPWLAQRRNKAWYRLVSNGARMYPQLIDELTKDISIDTGYKQVGLMKLRTDDKRLLADQERVLKRKEQSPEIGEITMLSERETEEKFPLLAPDIYRSIHVSGAARVHGGSLRNALITGAKKHGASIIKGSAMLLHENSHISGVSVAGEKFLADTVIAATGAWMDELLKPLGINFSVHPQKAQIIHLSLPGGYTDDWPVIMPPNNQYILPVGNGGIIIGATHETKAGFDKRVTAGGIHEVLNKALHVAPHLSEATLVETKVGFRPFTPGSLPVIGPLPNFTGLLLANGLGASGLTAGPFIASQLVNLALGEELLIDLENYDVAGAIRN